jgi:hypothetical protein
LLERIAVAAEKSVEVLEHVSSTLVNLLVATKGRSKGGLEVREDESDHDSLFVSPAPGR